MRRLLLCGLLVGAACSDPSQQRVEVPLRVAGNEAGREVSTQGDLVATLERADLAFGPLYLCAGVQAGDLCETARLEWLGSVVVDALDSNPQDAGALRGLSGTVQSWMYDLGISSQLTVDEPVELEAARQLQGVSLVVSGEVRLGTTERAFEIRVPARQGGETERGAPIVSTSTTDDFYYEVGAREAALTIRFDPTTWMTGLDFRPYLSSGDTEPIVIDSDGPNFRSVRNALVAGERPQFDWQEQ